MERITLHVPELLNDGSPVATERLGSYEDELLEIAGEASTLNGSGEVGITILQNVVGVWRWPNGAKCREPLRLYIVDVVDPTPILERVCELADRIMDRTRSAGRLRDAHSSRLHSRNRIRRSVIHPPPPSWKGDPMHDLTPARGFLVSREARTTGRELSRLDGRGRLEMARIDQEADLQAERLSALAYVGKRAMHEVTMLSQLEVQLSALVPSATPRLQGLGDMTALAMADVVSETIRKVK